MAKLWRRHPGRWRRFHRMGSSRRRLLVEAAFWLAVYRVALLIVPFRHLARRLGAAQSTPDGWAPLPTQCASTHPRVVTHVGWAVRCAARHVPFRAVCLPQAMAAMQMLRHRRISALLYFGVLRDDQGARVLHAWLCAEGIAVTGYPLAENLTPVACYTSVASP